MARCAYLHVIWFVLAVLIVLDLTLTRYSSSWLGPEAEQYMPLATYNRPLKCSPDTPCSYPETVDFRMIVITYNRKESTLKLLRSLNKITLDGATAALEVWIDQSKQNTVHYGTVKAAEEFRWEKGRKRVHIQERHVGIYGQWIDTWKPANGNELGLILEDDISVSPYAWRWIKAAHATFGNRSDILGYTLQSQGVNKAIGGGPLQVDPSMNVFLYRQMGSWGFVPHPKVWAEFQAWFHKVRTEKAFKPYVGGGVVFDVWYKSFEKKGTEDSMWTIWFIKYTNERNMYCVYNNIEKYSGKPNHKIAVHRAEAGLHHSGTGTNNEHELLSEWKDSYVQFPSKVPRYEFNGKMDMVDV